MSKQKNTPLKQRVNELLDENKALKKQIETYEQSERAFLVMGALMIACLLGLSITLLTRI